MFNFNFNWDAIADFNTNFNPVVFEQEVAALANVVTAAAVSAPAVVNTPVNVAPAPAVVQPVVQQVIQAVAPVVAPNVPPATLTKLEPIITEQIISSPAVIASPAGVVVEPKAVETIVSSIGTAASTNEDFVQTVTQAPNIDLSNQKADTLKTTDAAMAGTTVTPEKQYTQAEWARIQSRLPEGDRVPYENSPLKFDTAADVQARIDRFGEVIEPGVDVSEFPKSVTTPTVTDPDTGKQVPAPPGAPVYSALDGATGATGATDDNNLNRPPQPGSAWVWDEKSGKWIKPDMPTDGEYTWFDNRGWVKKTDSKIPLTPAEILALEKEENLRRDAFKLVESTMRSYGFNDQELKEIIDYINRGLLNPKLGPEQLVLELRDLNAYKTRFAGNEQRRAKGLNALTEANYLQQEDAYAATMRQYGVQRFANRAQFATFIGNDISNTEVGRRVKTAVERLQMGDPAILRQLRSYYAITDSDIVSYFLNPKEVLPELESKVTTAEIGATAKQYDLNADLTRASNLERYGVDLAAARTGYQEIAGRLPRAQMLTDIYKQSGIQYNQDVAEEETFKGTASAKRARERLKELEIGTFSGGPGTAKMAKRSTAGLI